MRSLADRLHKLEQRHAPPAPPPPVAYLDANADFVAEAAARPDAVAVLPSPMTADAWEAFAERQQAAAAERARACVRAMDPSGDDPEPQDSNVLPMRR